MSVFSRRIYADICSGFSIVLYDNSTIYIKHLTVFDQTEIDSLREAVLERTKKRGIATEADRLVWLEKKGLWTKREDADLLSERNYLENLEKTKSKLPLKVQIDQINNQINEAQNKVNQLAGKRARLIDKTAEQVADQRVQYEYIRLSFFSDVQLTKPLFTQSDIENLDDQEIDNLLFTYIEVVNQFSANALREIVIQPFFTNQFYLCGDEIRAFFGKPIVDLTIYQTNLLSYGQYFKSIMAQNDIPKEFLGTPDKIEEYVLRSRNMKTMADKMAKNADRVAIIGATPEDMKVMGVEDGSDKIRQDMQRGVKSGIEAAKSREVTFTNPR